MIKKNQVFSFLVLHLSVNVIISVSSTEILENSSNGKLNPINRNVDERKISKRHNELDFQTCLDNFEIHQDKIIRTQDSRAMGARYINERDVPSRDDCLRLCCETPDCDVFVFEERSPGSCYLFQCGTAEEFKCKFTKHRNYTSAVLPINRHMTELESQIKLTKHEHELTNLRQSDSSPTAIVLVTNTESTSSPYNKEMDQLIPPSNNNSANNRRCSRYQFECRSSEECIAIYNACDGIPQCSDGSDEAPELGCPALVTTIMPAERVNQADLTANSGSHKINPGNSLQGSQTKHHNHQLPANKNEEQIIRSNNKEFVSDSWVPQAPGYRSDEQSQHYIHHQELQLDQQQQKQNQPLPQQMLNREQPILQVPQRQKQQELQSQQQLLQENQQQKLEQQQEQLQHQHVQTGGSYMIPSNRVQQQMLTMSSEIPHQQVTQPQQVPRLDNMQPPQQLINQAKLYGREGEGLLYHSQTAGESMHWPLNNYQQEQSQDNNLPYRMSNPGMSQIFNHKGNSLVSQSERYRLQNHMYLNKAIAMEGGAGSQFTDNLPNDYNRYSNYFDNNQYRMMPHAQQNWQNVHKTMHDVNPMDEPLGGPREGETIAQPGLSNIGSDYYYEESARNKPQQMPQQRLAVQSNNLQSATGEQIAQGQYKEVKNSAHEEITLDHVNHDSVSTGQGPSVKKASVQSHSEVVTTEKPKDVKVHHHGHSSHRKIEQLTAEVTLRETSFDGLTMEQSGRPSGAILSLTLGMCVTAVMVVLVGCRMRTVRRRMRRGGKSAYAHDADFLVNGMYL